ncbi:MAG: helix-turn-helix transcriptional regulator [Porticoccaceae bacterium]
MDNVPRISLRAARVNAGLDQKEAARELGINRATLQNYEAGRTVPDWNIVMAIEKLYGFPASYIFFGKN